MERAPDPDLIVHGIVLDIQRFALNDGPGIRTTVFLKGCPLRCVWCHNPESQPFRPQLSFVPERCTHCLDCVPACTRGALLTVNERLVVNHGACDGCGECVDMCTEEALAVLGMEMTVAEVLAQVSKDRDYYAYSGGGLTLSGGEPLAQPSFSAALLREAHRHGIHTCLDTSGLTSRNRLDEVMPVTDLFLFDYKATDPDLHRVLTGVSNEPVLKNLEYLHEAGASIIIRCPLIPGVNDDDRHLAAIAELDRRLPNLRAIHLMAYHNTGREKAGRLGCESPLGYLPSADEAAKQRWLTTLQDLGCNRAEFG
jgi:glycyl-radical enzyme activating protein